MSIDLTVHARHGLEITSEFPTNSLSMELRPIAGFAPEPTSFLLYTSLEQWHELRKMIPKAEGYELCAQVAGNFRRFSNHAEADAWAEEFYTRELAKLAPPPAPVPNDEVGDILRGLPIIGTLNVDTNRFTPAPGYDATGVPQMIPVSEPDAQDDADIPDMPPEAPGTDDIVDEAAAEEHNELGVH